MSGDRTNPKRVIVVPAEPGRLVRLNELSNDRDEIDLVLDEMFGVPDDEGPGTTDAALIGGGAAAVIAGKLALLPAAAVVGGVAAIGLGAILPMRSLYRRVNRRKHERGLDKLIGDGTLLDTQHRAVQRLISSHERVQDLAGQQPPVVSLRSTTVAHNLVHEVATLLDGHELTDTSEEAYVLARVEAMHDLAEALAMPVDSQSRRAQLHARLEVESVAGTSGISDAAELTSDLLSERDI